MSPSRWDFAATRIDLYTLAEWPESGRGKGLCDSQEDVGV